MGREESTPSLAHQVGVIVSNPGVPSLYVWAATIGLPVVRVDAPILARGSALAALLCAVAAMVLLQTAPVVARRIGVFGFVGCALGTWAALGPETMALARDPFVSILGAFGWVAFAFGWGRVRRVGSVPEEHPAALHGQVLQARERVPPAAQAASMIALLGAAGCLLLAWRIDRPAHAIFGHVVALAASLGLLWQSALFTQRDVTVRPRGVRRRLSAASSALLLLVATLIAGALLWQLRVRAG